MKILKMNYQLSKHENACIIKDAISHEVIIAFKINMEVNQLKEHFYFGVYEPNIQKLIEKLTDVHAHIFKDVVDEEEIKKHRYMRAFIELYEYSLLPGDYLEKFYEHMTSLLSGDKSFKVSYMLKDKDVNYLDLSSDNPCVKVSRFDGSYSDLLIIDYTYYKEEKATGELNAEVICVIGQNEYEILIGPVFKNETYIYRAQGIQKYSVNYIEKFERKLVEFFIGKYIDIVCFKLNLFSNQLEIFPSRGVIHIKRSTLDLVHETVILSPRKG